MKKGLLVTGAILLVAVGAFLIAQDVVAGCGGCAHSKSEAAAVAKTKAPCAHAAKTAEAKTGCSGCPSTKESSMASRQVYPLENGVMLVYSGSCNSSIAQARYAANKGCRASCPRVAAESAGKSYSCSHHAGDEPQGPCPSKLPEMAGVQKQVVETANGAIVIITTERQKNLEALHEWAGKMNEQAESTRASLQ
jgi:hypothetical protein